MENFEGGPVFEEEVAPVLKTEHRESIVIPLASVDDTDDFLNGPAPGWLWRLRPVAEDPEPKTISNDNERPSYAVQIFVISALTFVIVSSLWIIFF